MKLKKGARALLIIVLISLLVLQVFFAYKLVDFIKPKENDEELILLKYKSKSNSTYNVNFKSEAITTSDLSETDAYITSFVEGINFITNYNYSATKKASLIGTYKIEANVVAYHKINSASDKKSNPKIWEKKETIKSTSFSEKSDILTKSESFTIDLNFYQEKLDAFKETAEDVNIDAELQIKITTNFKGIRNKKSFDENYIESFIIPLSTEVFTIEHNVTENNDDTVIYYNEITKATVEETMPYILVNLLIFVIIIVLIKILISANGKSKYIKEKEKIEKNYQEILINTSTIVNDEEYTVIKIKDFNELFELSRELNQPIMQYTNPDELGVLFYIIKEEILYKFILHEDINIIRKHKKNRS